MDKSVAEKNRAGTSSIKLEMKITNAACRAEDVIKESLFSIALESKATLKFLEYRHFLFKIKFPVFLWFN
jgi:hypothetical protein